MAVAVWLTYRGPLDGPFIFDDVPTVVSNLSLRRLWPLVNLDEGLGPLSQPPQTSVSGRPVANLSLAVDYHFSKLNRAAIASRIWRCTRVRGNRAGGCCEPHAAPRIFSRAVRDRG